MFTGVATLGQTPNQWCKFIRLKSCSVCGQYKKVPGLGSKKSNKKSRNKGTDKARVMEKIQGHLASLEHGVKQLFLTPQHGGTESVNL